MIIWQKPTNCKSHDTHMTLYEIKSVKRASVVSDTWPVVSDTGPVVSQ